MKVPKDFKHPINLLGGGSDAEVVGGEAVALHLGELLRRHVVPTPLRHERRQVRREDLENVRPRGLKGAIGPSSDVRLNILEIQDSRDSRTDSREVLRLAAVRKEDFTLTSVF